MKKRTKKLKPQIKITLAITVLFVIMIYILYLFDLAVRPIIYQFAEMQTKLLSVLAINNAVTQQINQQQQNFDKLTKINYDSNGEIVSINVDSVAANVVKEDLINEINLKLIDLQEQDIQIPLGTVMNWTLLSGRGPKVNVKIVPLSFATAQIKSTLEGAGVNQTIHKISVVVNVEMSALIYGYTKTTSISNEIILSQTVIVGDVPPMMYNNS